ncbi:hypothetical protein [Shewanella atlantica]
MNNTIKFNFNGTIYEVYVKVKLGAGIYAAQGASPIERSRAMAMW